MNPLSIKPGAICIIKRAPLTHPGWKNRYVTALTAPSVQRLVCEVTGRDFTEDRVVLITAPWMPPVPIMEPGATLNWCLPAVHLFPITDPDVDVNTWTGDVSPMFFRPEPHEFRVRRIGNYPTCEGMK